MPIGTVKFFNADKGYGFIQPEDGGQDAFVHISAVEAAGMRTLDKEQRVSYELEQDRRGKTSAVNLTAASAVFLLPAASVAGRRICRPWWRGGAAGPLFRLHFVSRSRARD